jgi:hypothetical protein
MRKMNHWLELPGDLQPQFQPANRNDDLMIDRTLRGQTISGLKGTDHGGYTRCGLRDNITPKQLLLDPVAWK